MTKAAAPMMGGMIWPPVDATASTPAAKCGLKPVRFMSGIEIGPSTMTLATALPEMVPNRLDDTTDTFPGPPARHEKAIGEKDEGRDRQGPADQPPRRLDHHDDEHDREDHVRHGQVVD